MENGPYRSSGIDCPDQPVPSVAGTGWCKHSIPRNYTFDIHKNLTPFDMELGPFQTI